MLKRAATVIIALFLALSSFRLTLYADGGLNSDVLGDADAALVSIVSASSGKRPSMRYDQYLQLHKDTNKPNIEITIPAASYTADHGASAGLGSYMGIDSALIWGSQQGGLEWVFSSPRAGLYAMSIEYCGMPGRNNSIRLQLMLNGEVPYSNAEVIFLPRWYKNENNDFATDKRGNQIRPRQIEVFEWQFYTVRDGDGQHREHLYFYLNEGENSLQINSLLEPFAINAIRFHQVKSPVTYAEAKASWDATGAGASNGFLHKVEAEFANLKSESVLFPTSDTSRFSMSPSSPNQIRFNTLGQNTWNTAGQSVSWEVEVPEDGYYLLAFKGKQSIKRGMFSTRAIYINGEIPFAELGNVQFPHRNSWYMQTVPYEVYLTAGKHTIAMEAVIGDEAELLRRVEQLVIELNEWYRRIIVITGSNADSERITVDLNRDFNLHRLIPGLIDGFEAAVDELGQAVALADMVYGEQGSSATSLAETKHLLERLIDRPDRIARYLEAIRSNVSAMAVWVLEMRYQPLELDYFIIYSPDMPEPTIQRNFFKQLWFRLQAFIFSFNPYYNTLGDGPQGANVIDVWVSTSDMMETGIASGRDQAQIIKTMVDDLFTPKTGIEVNLSLVNSSTTLVQAVLAGKGPDAALVVSKATPVDLAMRNAVVALCDYPGFDEILSRFMPSAIIPYQFLGKTYALPETQNFDVLFYRTDIFEGLGLTAPETWADFYYTVGVLQQNNLITGIIENQRYFEALLFQHGGAFFNEDLSRTELYRPEALAAFEEWTGFYTRYSLPLRFDFFNRFRSGEMPMALMPYTQSNWLEAAAPELRNLWDFAPIPGRMQDDGTVNRAVTPVGTACIILKNSDKHSESFEFIDWWTSTSVQARFGNELENLMGSAARYPTANVEALLQLPWTRQQSETLLKQWREVAEIPQIPGSYYINRNIMFAFRAIVLGDGRETEREALNRHDREINREISRKRQEFGLVN